MAATKKTTLVSEQRKQEPLKLWVFFLSLVVLNFVSGIGVVYSTHNNRVMINELQKQEERRNQLQVEWGQLLLEQSSLVSQGRIEELAVRELGMKVPELDRVVVVRDE